MGSRIFVGNLGEDLTEADLVDLFSPFGEVVEVSIIVEWETKRSRGFGFVQMGSEGAAQEAIQTLHGKEIRGRRLRVVEAQPKQPGAAPKPLEAPSSRRQTDAPHPLEDETTDRRARAHRPAARRLALWLLAPSAALLGWWSLLLFGRPQPSPNVVLVVPFDVFGQTDGADYLGHAFAQAIAVNLAPAKEHRVLPVPSKLASEARVTAARDAGAGRLVVGTLTRKPPMLHASVTLVEPAENRILWGTQRESHEGEMIQLGSQLARDLAAQLGVSFPTLHPHITDLTGGPEMSRAPITAVALAALRRGEIGPALDATAELYAAFPDDVAAVALRCQALLLQWDAQPSPQNLEQLEATIAKLEQTGRGYPYDAFYRAFVDARQHREVRAVERFSRLLDKNDLAPGARAWVLRYRALARQNAADLDGALDDLRKSLELDPTNAWTLSSLSGALEQSGRRTEALERALQALALAPSYWRNHQAHGYVLAALGRWEDAADAYARACELGRAQVPCSLRAVALMRSGDTEAARAVADEAAALVESPWGIYNLACYAALAGDRRGALERLRRAAALGLDADTMERDPDLASLQGDNGFRALLAELRAKQP